ncbi:MAG: hypothetical protein ACI4OI_00115 [Gemmiger sp.]
MKKENRTLFLGKVLGIICVLFLFCLVAAMAEGSIFWPVGIALALLDLVVLNSICGALLPEEPVTPAVSIRGEQEAPAALRIVPGGNAA